jgi:hypothetical protein
MSCIFIYVLVLFGGALIRAHRRKLRYLQITFISPGLCTTIAATLESSAGNKITGSLTQKRAIHVILTSNRLFHTSADIGMRVSIRSFFCILVSFMLTALYSPSSLSLKSWVSSFLFQHTTSPESWSFKPIIFFRDVPLSVFTDSPITTILGIKSSYGDFWCMGR